MLCLGYLSTIVKCFNYVIFDTFDTFNYVTFDNFDTFMLSYVVITVVTTFSLYSTMYGATY